MKLTTKKAFTLTEVLIAMTVLGIIIAATVPVIFRTSPNKNAIMLKKAYYTTEAIVDSLINDEALFGEDGFNDTSQVRVPGTNIDTDSHGIRKFMCLFASKLNVNPNPNIPDKLPEGTKVTDFATRLEDVCNEPFPTDYTRGTYVQTNDGTLWILTTARFQAPRNNAVTIEVDVNDGLSNVSYYYTGEHLHRCESGQLGGACTEEEVKKRFDKLVDRAVFTITKDGQILIEDQDYISDIISGREKIFGK